MLKLTINIDKTGLATLSDAGYRIALLADTRPGPLLLACLLPPIATQTVTWTDAAALYVSLDKFKEGNRISINSKIAASAGQKYLFSFNTLTENGNSDKPNSVQLQNANSETVTSGLATSFSTSGNDTASLAPITGVTALASALATFEAQNDYLISALIGADVGAVMLPSDFAGEKSLITPTATLALTPLPFATEQVDSLSVDFNSTTNAFETATS